MKKKKQRKVGKIKKEGTTIARSKKNVSNIILLKYIKTSLNWHVS